MESDRVMKIEKQVGLALMIANCIRLAFGGTLQIRLLSPVTSSRCSGRFSISVHSACSATNLKRMKLQNGLLPEDCGQSPTANDLEMIALSLLSQVEVEI
jgi:hypothetical protein